MSQNDPVEYLIGGKTPSQRVISNRETSDSADEDIPEEQ